MIRDIPTRFEKSYIPEPNSGCWLWLGTIDKAGYGRFTIGRRGTNKITGAHIVSYIIAHNKLPPSELDHTCKLRCCVNPDHLEPVTHLENIMRGTSPSALHARQTHCINGHEFTNENTYVWRGPKGDMRQCRTCGRRNSLKYLRGKNEVV